MCILNTHAHLGAFRRRRIARKVLDVFNGEPPIEVDTQVENTHTRTYTGVNMYICIYVYNWFVVPDDRQQRR